MRKLLLLCALCSATAFGYDLNQLPTKDKALLLLQIKNRLKTNSYKKNKPAKINCSTIFDEEKDRYHKLIDEGEDRLMRIKMISGRQPFTKEEMVEMAEEHPHITSHLRGNDESVSMATLVGGIEFPHSYSHCNNFFESSVEVVDVDDKVCRRITFESEEIGAQSYTQEYCSDDYHVKIYFN